MRAAVESGSVWFREAPHESHSTCEKFTTRIVTFFSVTAYGCVVTQQRTDIGNAIRSTLVSPNESDSNGESANVVDGLFAIARAIENLATAVTRVSHGDVHGPAGLEMLSMAINGEGTPGANPVTAAIREGFGDLAEAIRDGQRQ